MSCTEWACCFQLLFFFFFLADLNGPVWDGKSRHRWCHRLQGWLGWLLLDVLESVYRGQLYCGVPCLEQFIVTHLKIVLCHVFLLMMLLLCSALLVEMIMMLVLLSVICPIQSRHCITLSLIVFSFWYSDCDSDVWLMDVLHNDVVTLAPLMMTFRISWLF